jgi:hypothetical protein
MNQEDLLFQVGATVDAQNEVERRTRIVLDDVATFGYIDECGYYFYPIPGLMELVDYLLEPKNYPDIDQRLALYTVMTTIIRAARVRGITHGSVATDRLLGAAAQKKYLDQGGAEGWTRAIECILAQAGGGPHLAVDNTTKASPMNDDEPLVG